MINMRVTLSVRVNKKECERNLSRNGLKYDIKHCFVRLGGNKGIMIGAYFELRVNFSDGIPVDCEVRGTLADIKGVDSMVIVSFLGKLGGN